jgi:hypothetical protein
MQKKDDVDANGFIGKLMGGDNWFLILMKWICYMNEELDITIGI